MSAQEVLDRSAVEIDGLIAEAKSSGMPLGHAVVLVIDLRDSTGKLVAESCKQLGLEVMDETVCVVGVPRHIARGVLLSVHHELAKKLAVPVYEERATVIVFSSGNVLERDIGPAGLLGNLAIAI